MRRAALLSLVTLALTGHGELVLAQQIQRASIATSGVQSHGAMEAPVISADGRFVAFTSEASDLVPGDTNGVADVFVRDLLLGTTERVSVANGGAQANGAAVHAGISGDGRWVVFESSATNLTANPDTNGASDVFLRDRSAGTTVLISGAAPSQPTFGQTARGASHRPAISANGARVAFYSSADDLLAPGVDTNGFVDAFVYDVSAATTTRISVGPGGVQADWHSGELPVGTAGGTSLSRDGRFVVFQSVASNLVPGANSGFDTAYVADLALGTLDVVARRLDGLPSIRPAQRAQISVDGTCVVFVSPDASIVANDTNGASDVFVWQRASGTYEIVDRDSLGGQAVHTGPPSSVPLGGPAISGDGRYVAFDHNAQNLVPGDVNEHEDVFVHDRVTHVTQLASRGASGVSANGDAWATSISADGARVVFLSDASDLVPGDSNSSTDVFVAGVPVAAVTTCAGDGTGTGCPCGNFGASGRGCASSTSPLGARLAATGAASLGADSFTLLAQGLPPSSIVRFLQGTTSLGGGAGVVFGDGLRCVGGTVLRLGTRSTGAQGSLAFGQAVSGDPRVSVQGSIGAPGTRTYQALYRNAVAFCTSATVNLSNALTIDWAP